MTTDGPRAALEALVDSLNIEQYGKGVPGGLAITGGFALVLGARGATKFAAETMYGKIGIVTLFAVAIVCISAAGYTYQAIDTDEWVMNEEDDGPDSGGSLSDSAPESIIKQER